MNIKLWYSKSMGQWRWSLTDEYMDMASGQQPELRDAMQDIATTVEYMMDKREEQKVSI
jgi:hypothetical protein|tara:strand:+ start:471 stop:647 length:177 start_codon:yes stop_codon:yes gene_type:complete